MVFGFLRHAPADSGLNVWLSSVFGRPVTADPLTPVNFWPSLRSQLDGHVRTEPELVIEADDGARFVVVIEAKPGYGMHREDQLVREIVDTAYHTDTTRIALIAIGADVGAPRELEAWTRAGEAALRDHGRSKVSLEMRYASWASLGDVIATCASAVPQLALYAADVTAQLRLNGLLGYKGAPVLDDLDEMNLTNAFIAVNRAILAARQFFLTLHDQESFHTASLQPWSRNHKMLRDGTSTALTQHEEYFQMSTFICTYRIEGCGDDAGAFAAIYLGDEEGPKLQVGAFAGDDPQWGYAWTEDVEEVQEPRLQRIDKAVFPWAAAGGQLEVVYDERLWIAGGETADVAWAIDRLVMVSSKLRGAE